MGSYKIVMSSNNKALTEKELLNLADLVLKYFGSIEQLQAYWKTTIGKEINELATKEFGVSLYRFKQVVLGILHIEDKTKEDIKLLKQKAWEERPAYTQEQINRMYAKRKETCRELYGVDNVFQAEEIKEKIRDTCLDKYGVANINSLETSKLAKSENFKRMLEEELTAISEKRKQTNLQRYGVSNPFISADFTEKALETKEQRYGDRNYNNRVKAKDTCLVRYGAEHFSQTLEFLNMSKFRKYYVDGLFFDSYPELAIYFYCINNKIPIKRNPVRLEYEFKNKKHYCFPDFIIDDKLIEIKGNHLYEKMLIPETVDNAKLKCLAKNDVEIWTIDRYRYYITWFEEHGLKKEDYLVKR